MTPTFILHRGGAALAGYDSGGQGIPLLFQHGLGGAIDEIEETLPPLAEFRRLTLECRAHGLSSAGRERPFSLPLFADDVLAFLDTGRVNAFVAGGLSMGASIALRLAVRCPGRVRALILVRPAWLFEDAPPTLLPQVAAGTALRQTSPDEAKAAFLDSALAARLAQEAPTNLQSLLRWFDRPKRDITADLLTGIAASGPGVTKAEAAGLRVPTLVIGHGGDRTHPWAYAQHLASVVPGARLVEVAPKADNKAAHLAQIGAAITAFLQGLDPDRLA